MRKQTADLQPAPAVFTKLERRLNQVTDRPAIGADRRIALVWRVVELREGRLVIERVDVTRSAVHKEEDGVLGLGREMRLLRREQVARIRRGCLLGEETVARQQID